MISNKTYVPVQGGIAMTNPHLSMLPPTTTGKTCPCSMSVRTVARVVCRSESSVNIEVAGKAVRCKREKYDPTFYGDVIHEK